MSELFAWFADPGRSNLANWVITFATLVVATLGLWVGWRQLSGGKQVTTKKARLRAELAREPGSRRMRDLLRIYNDGEVEARNIAINLAGTPLLEHAAVPGGTTEIKTVGPRSQIQYVIAVTMGNTPPWELEITWTDDSGEESSYRTTLTL